MARIRAKNKKYTGVIAGVTFANGVGETNDSWLKQWFENKGYEVEEDKNYLSALKVDELKDLAKQKGLDGYSDMKKAELIELIENAENED